MARKALSGKNAPRSLRLGLFAIVWLVADRLDPSPTAWGVIYTLMAITAIILVVDFFTAKDVELDG